MSTFFYYKRSTIYLKHVVYPAYTNMEVFRFETNQPDIGNFLNYFLLTQTKKCGVYHYYRAESLDGNQ